MNYPSHLRVVGLDHLIKESFPFQMKWRGSIYLLLEVFLSKYKTESSKIDHLLTFFRVA